MAILVYVASISLVEIAYLVEKGRRAGRNVRPVGPGSSTKPAVGWTMSITGSRDVPGPFAASGETSSPTCPIGSSRPRRCTSASHSSRATENPGDGHLDHLVIDPRRIANPRIHQALHQRFLSCSISKYVLANVEAVKQNCRNRNVPADVLDDLDRFVELEGERKALLQAVEEVRRRQNEVAQATGKEKDPARRAELVAEGKRLKSEIAENEDRLKQLDADVKRRLARIPNLTHPDAPVGAHRGREPRAAQGRHAPHLRLHAEGPRRDRQGARPDRLRERRQGHGPRLLLPQERRGAPGAGAPAVRHAEAGRGTGSRRSSRPTWPAISILEGIGFTPRGPETQIYSVEDTDLCLIGTAEITLGGMHADEILDEAAAAAEIRRPVALLPHRGRRRGPGEQGALPRPPVHQGRDVRLHHPRGLGRDARASSWRSRRRSSPRWGSPTACSTSARATWAGRPTASSTSRPGCPAAARAGEYGEVTSTSNCTDYQARRLNIRYQARPARRGRGSSTRSTAPPSPEPGPDRHPGELPAGRRPRGRPRSLASLPGQGGHRSMGVTRARHVALDRGPRHGSLADHSEKRVAPGKCRQGSCLILTRSGAHALNRPCALLAIAVSLTLTSSRPLAAGDAAAKLIYIRPAGCSTARATLAARTR